MLFNLFFVNTGRTGMVVFLAVLFLFATLRLSVKNMIYGLLFVIIILSTVFLFSKPVNERLSQSINQFKLAGQGNFKHNDGLRLSMYSNSLKIIQQSPVIGHGTGSVKKKFIEVESEKFLQVVNPHNEYFNVGIQLGLVGLLYLIAMFVFHYVSANKLELLPSLVAKGVVVATVVGSAFNSLLMDFTEGHLYVVMLAICFNNCNYRLRPKHVSS